MASDKRPFTHITVNADEEDDLVIQAGAVSAGEPSCGGGDPSGEDAASGGASADADHAEGCADALREHGDDDRDADLDADEDAAASEAACSDASEEEGASVRRAGAEKPREGTSLQDLENAKMGGLQKAIVAVAVLAVVAFAVYYIFFR